ncbi:MAG: alpha/beta hydrolase [Nocardioidaceae bacterium]|nr:alpha/beta hydrolase [Nocardioidaceae bacterium]NUS52270.1 alpha/beta hydrolase [Nocardioidaceae bacterium]
MTTTQFLPRPEGRVAYDVAGPGDGPLVVCLPAMGELRSSFRHLVPLLTARGFRVACLDLRGHGDSDPTFTRYDDVALASDALALVHELGGPALLVGNSMGAGAAVIAAADEPSAVSGLALVGPFVRNPPGSALVGLVFRLALVKPWGPAAYLAYYPKWTPGRRPEGYDEHTAAVRENLRRPGHWKAFVRTTRTSHAPAEARLDEVRSPAVVVMGSDDVDWKDPAAEAQWIGSRLGAEVVMAAGVGHYPQAQAPELVADAVARLAAHA